MLKIQNNDSLLRDNSSGAIINKNNKELEEYKLRKKMQRDNKILLDRVFELEQKVDSLYIMIKELTDKKEWYV